MSGDRKNHNDASVFMNDSTVCEGYARIANILYNTAGIETYYISGVNQDNIINFADLVTLNKIILNIPMGDNIDYVLTDLIFDGLVDSFDLVKM